MAVPLAFGLVVLLAYFPALRIPFLSDDSTLLALASTDRFDPSVLSVLPDWLFYRPLGRGVWLITYQLWGYNVIAYHAVSLLIHWLNGLLVVAFARRLIPGQTAVPLIAGLLFVLLPMQVEAVAWLSSQHDLLATAGYLTTLLCLLAAWRRRQPWLYLLSLGTFQLTLWAKESSFSLPIMVMVLGMAIRDHPRPRTAIASAAPYALLVGLNLMQRYAVWGTIGGYPNVRTDYLSFVWNHIARTLQTLLAPLNQALFPPEVIQVWMLVMAGLVLAGLLTTRNQRVILLSLGWIVITILPVLNILPVAPNLENSRFLYLPAVGFALGLAALLESIAGHIAPRRREWAAYMGAVALSLAYLLALRAHLQPWDVAGRGSVHILEQLHRVKPVWASGGWLQVVGLPDNYKGAYIFRNSLYRSLMRNYGSTFSRLDRLDKLPRLPYDQASGDVLQVAFDFDPIALGWELKQARGVSAKGDGILASGGQGTVWDFSACDIENGWAYSQATARCEPNVGLELAPSNGVPYLTSPPLALPAGGWTEIVVDMAIREQPKTSAAIRLLWTTDPSESWRDDHSLLIELPTNSANYRYQFYIPPDSSSRLIKRLRLEPSAPSGTTVIRSMVVRELP